VYKNYFKRMLDFIFSILILVLISPIIILVMILLFVATSENPFFVQTRPGLNEKIFRIVKFKTMNEKKDEKGVLLPDAMRLTKIGTIIRKTSLDELPQLFNVLKGDMSLIGPRPLLLRYLPYYTYKERLRHTIRPGITGWAQVNGRNTIGWDKRLDYDVYYVENISFCLDMKIVLQTIKSILFGKDIVIDPESELQNFDVQRINKISDKT
jgi:undecaprenyl phosphate N,N'-diacetylbacillosamine 1-phosphate transferase